MNFDNRNTIKLLMITYFNAALVTNGQIRKTMIIHVTLYRKLMKDTFNARNFTGWA